MAQEGDVVLITGKDDISQFVLAFLLFCTLFFSLDSDISEGKIWKTSFEILQASLAGVFRGIFFYELFTSCFKMKLFAFEDSKKEEKKIELF